MPKYLYYTEAYCSVFIKRSILEILSNLGYRAEKGVSLNSGRQHFRINPQSKLIALFPDKFPDNVYSAWKKLDTSRLDKYYNSWGDINVKT